MIQLNYLRFFLPETREEIAFSVRIFKKYCGLWNVSHRVGLSAYSSCPPSAFLSRRRALDDRRTVIPLHCGKRQFDLYSVPLFRARDFCLKRRRKFL